MPTPDKGAFIQVFPKCFVIFICVIELLSALVLIATELGNVASNFWTTNVFAGGWCGIIMLIHFLALACAGCCVPGPSAAFRAVVITVIALLACGTCIGFDAYFIAQPSACLLTSSCSSNAVSTTVFSYNLQQSFFTLFNKLGPFSSYTQTQAKFLFQTIQLGVASLCFVLCLIYFIIYYVTKSKASKRVGPSPNQGYGNQGYGSQPQSQYQGQSYHTPRQPQAAPGELPWSSNNRRY